MDIHGYRRDPRCPPGIPGNPYILGYPLISMNILGIPWYALRRPAWTSQPALASPAWPAWPGQPNPARPARPSLPGPAWPAWPSPDLVPGWLAGLVPIWMVRPIKV